MESKKMNRKFNSIFWSIIYCLPLIILLITFVGNYYVYKETGNLHYDEIETVETVLTESNNIVAATPDTYIKNLYFDTSLSYESVAQIMSDSGVEAINIDGFGYAALFLVNINIINGLDPNYIDYDDYIIGFFYELGAIVNIATYMKANYEDNTEMALNSIYFVYQDVSDYGFTGWNPNFNGVIPVNSNTFSSFQLSLETNGELVSYDVGLSNDALIDLFYTKELVEVEQTVITKLSLFDISVKDTINSFKDFTFVPLVDTLENVFVKLDFNLDSYISKFAVILFTWFSQSMFIHILIDLFTFIPKIYHSLMERWL